jgi:hypothetical protein
VIFPQNRSKGLKIAAHALKSLNSSVEMKTRLAQTMSGSFSHPGPLNQSILTVPLSMFQ